MIGSRSVLLEGSFCPAPSGPALQVLGLLWVCLIYLISAGVRHPQSQG